jgi:hypothetical protein
LLLLLLLLLSLSAAGTNFARQFERMHINHWIFKPDPNTNPLPAGFSQESTLAAAAAAAAAVPICSWHQLYVRTRACAH